MRLSSLRWWRIGLLGTLGIALAAAPGSARPVTYVIAFDGVLVREPYGVPLPPELAHLDLPAPVDVKEPNLSPSSGVVRSGTPSPGVRYGKNVDISREGKALDLALEQGILDREGQWYVFQGMRLGTRRAGIKQVLRRHPEVLAVLEAELASGGASAPAAALRGPSPHSVYAFAPGKMVRANPSFVEKGFVVEAFWAVRIGSADAYFARAHFHPPDLATGFEAQHLGNARELHGLFIRSADGRPFGVKSLRYRVTRNRQIPTRSISIAGFTNFSVEVLLARSFDPRRPVRGQFEGFPVGLAVGNDPTLPWATLHVFGFELVTEIYIASSASVDIDDIVLVRNEVDAPPDVPAESEDVPAESEDAPGSHGPGQAPR
ncbi:MAG TPA: hypothetical protein VMT79_03425 [Candidatus Binatia bacterium]|nr:hypothetical protein [Candidatus Binatia bacterium]